MVAGTLRVGLSSPARMGGSERGARGACRRFRLVTGRCYRRPVERFVPRERLTGGTG